MADPVTLQPNPIDAYTRLSHSIASPEQEQIFEGNTLEKVLATICSANKILTEAAGSFLKRLNTAIENVRKRSEEQQKLMKKEALTGMFFEIARGAALGASGIVPAALGPNNPLSNVIKTTCEAAAPILQGAGNVVSTGYKARQEEETTRRNIEQQILLQGNQDSNAYAERARDTLNNAGNQILQAKSRTN